MNLYFDSVVEKDWGVRSLNSTGNPGRRNFILFMG